MTLALREQHAQDRIEGREPSPDWSDDPYASVDERTINLLTLTRHRHPIVR
jgi:hypothetical protein